MEESTQTLASRWKRLGGALLDGLIMTAIVVPLMWITGMFGQLAQGQPITLGQSAFLFVLGWGVFLAVNGYLLANKGQTVGKRVAGTRMVSHTDGQLLPLVKLFGLRYLVVGLIAHIPFLGGLFSLVDVLFIFREDRRCIHDLIAGTKVVDA